MIKENDRSIAGLFSVILMLFVVCESMMNKLIITVLPIDNILGYSMVFFTMLTLFSSRIKMNTKFIICYITCWIILGFSSIFVGGSYVMEYVFQYLSFGTCGVICALCMPVRFKAFLKAATVLTVVFIVISIMEHFEDAEVSSFNFGYALIPGVISTFLYICYLIEEKKRASVVMVIVLFLVEIVVFLKYSSRGNLVQLFAFGIGVIMVIYGRKLLGIILLSLGGIAILSIDKILVFLYELTQKYGVNISAISKSYYLIVTPTESLTHGRSELLTTVIANTSFGSILFGNGVGRFEQIAGTYAHNSFLESFFEFGLLGVILMAIIYICCLKRMFDRSTTIREKHLFLLLFVTVLVKMLFSSTYWRISGFWFLLGLLFQAKKREKVIYSVESMMSTPLYF